jgi:hypothetical protein
LVNIPEAETIHGEEIMNEIKKKIWECEHINNPLKRWAFSKEVL